MSKAGSSKEPQSAAALSLEIVVEDERWGGEAGLQARVDAVAPKIATHPDARLQGAVLATLVLADDAMVQDLNKRFRGQDKPTNVLSFPAGDVGMPVEGERHLGDVILAYETVVREAEAGALTLDHHLVHLIVHGVLHLAGHDHIDERDAVVMEDTETAILATLGIADPYAELD